MFFKIHKKARYNLNYSKIKYKADLIEYLNYLHTLNVSKANMLIKYFGLSFFHGGKIDKIGINPKGNSITLLLYREDDYEDINEFRVKNKLHTIDKNYYYKNPLIYECILFGVKNMCFNTKILPNMYIIDTEVVLDKNTNNYILNISIDERHELSILCKNAKIQIIKSKLIKKYTNGLATAMPYCNGCKTKLITKKGICKTIGNLNA